MPLSDFAYLNTYIFQSNKQILTLDNLEQDNLNKYKMHFLNSDFEFFFKGKKAIQTFLTLWKKYVTWAIL